MKAIKFEPSAYEEFGEWAKENPKVFQRILEIIKDIDKDPFKGIAKPEPLKYKLKGYWSRRITEEHRLIYKIGNAGDIYILSCKGHYSDK